MMRGNTVAKILIVLLVVSFIAHQVNSSVYKPITTENVNYYEAVEGLNITGMILRGEYLVTCDTAGVYHYLIEDGSRVAKGGTIANIYDNENASITMSEIDDLNEQIKNLNDLQNYNNQQAADLGLVNNRVDEAIDNLIVGSAYGNFTDMHDKCEELLLSLNRRRMLTGEQTDFSKHINQLNERLNELKSNLPNAKGRITAVQSGYFSTSVDGYETAFDFSDLSKVTVDFLDNVKPQAIEGNVVGKIVSDYEWYIAAKVSINDSLKYKVGDSLTIRTLLRSTPELSVKVAAINLSETVDSAVVVFSCNQMSKELAAMRTGTMTVVNAVHSGLKVAKTALRVVDSQTGVYVVSGISLNFVPVEVLYTNENEGYIICKQEQSNSQVLRLYDEVVVKGKKLYDGKVVG